LNCQTVADLIQMGRPGPNGKFRPAHHLPLEYAHLDAGDEIWKIIPRVRVYEEIAPCTLDVCTWSGMRCPSMIWHSFCRAKALKIGPNWRRVWPKNRPAPPFGHEYHVILAVPLRWDRLWQAPDIRSSSCWVIKPLEEDLTPGTVKPVLVALVEPVAYQIQLASYRIATVMVAGLAVPPTETTTAAAPEGTPEGTRVLIWMTPATSPGAPPA